MPNMGLANPHNAYDIRVKSVSDSVDYLDSAHSGTVRIEDNPLLLPGGSANGNSPSNLNVPRCDGHRRDDRASLAWTKITDVVEYTVRYRKLGNRDENVRHSDVSWPDDHD